MLYVVKTDSTNIKQVKTGIARLQQVNVPLGGVVLNQVDMEKSGKYADYVYGGYYDTYGYVGDTKPKA